MHSAADYKQQLNALLPQGVLWDALRQDGTAQALLLAIADEFARLDGRAESLLREIDPRTTVELLMEREEFVGLPDICTGTQEQLIERQEALFERLSGVGGQSRQYYIDVAARLGYAITITEFTVTNVNADVNAPMTGVAWAYAWQINGLSNTYALTDVNAGVNEPMAKWGTTPLECVIRRLAPAHTVPVFSYT